MSTTRKLLLFALTLTVLGGLAFAGTQSTWLKGVWGGEDGTWSDTGDQMPSGGGMGGIPTMETSGGGLDGGTVGTVEPGTEDDNLPYVPGGYTNPGPGPGTGGGTSEPETYHISLLVKNMNEDGITGLTTSNITSTDGTIESLEEDGNGSYSLTMSSSGTYTIKVAKDGYITTSEDIATWGSQDDMRPGGTINMPYGHVITVVSEDGDKISGATVKVGTSTSKGTTGPSMDVGMMRACENYQDNLYGCTSQASTTKQSYSVTATGYNSKTGTFSTAYTASRTSSVTATVTLTETVNPGNIYIEVTDADGSFISGLSETDFTSSESFESFTAGATYYHITTAAAGSYSIEVNADGYIGASKTFTSSESSTVSLQTLALDFGHIITVVDEAGSAITGATVSAGPSTSSLETCINYESNKYGCSIPQSYTVKNSYQVSKSGYQVATGVFSAYYVKTNSNPTTETVTLSLEEVAPAETTTSFSCSSIAFSPSSKELDADLASQDITFSIVMSFDTQIAVWQRSLFAMVSLASTDTWTGDLKLSSTNTGDFTEESSGDTGNPLTVDISTDDGANLTLDFTYTDAEDGDTITATLTPTDGSAGSSCTDTLNITQAASTADDDDDDDTTTTVTADDDDDDTTTTYTTTLDTILRSESYNCDDDFTDTSNVETKDVICRMTQADVVEGTDPPKYFSPNDYITNAEAIKIIVGLLLEKDEGDAYGLSEDLVDVDENNSDHWFVDWVIVALDEDVVRTRDFGGYFFPNEPCSRGQLAVYVARALGLTTYNYSVDFTDVDHDSPYAYAISLFSDEDNAVDVPYDDDSELIPVIQGYSNNTFRPENSITRSEALAMIYRAYLSYK